VKCRETEYLSGKVETEIKWERIKWGFITFVIVQYIDGVAKKEERKKFITSHSVVMLEA
jgi:hypothetical protein